MATIDTNPPSGTRDFLAAEVVRRRRAFATVRDTFEAHGFEPLDTPAFERLEVLLGKYGEEGDKLIFKILRRGEHEATGEADLALRYDLTVPLARVVAQYSDQIIEPWKRYHIGPVWRADRPGKGRYREFTQCDVDIVGSDSPLADAAVILAVTDALAALGLADFEVQVNSRRALRGLIEAYGVAEADEEHALVAIDKLDKLGPDGVAEELGDRGVDADTAKRLAEDLAAPDVDERVRRMLKETVRGGEGVEEVDEVLRLVGPNLTAGTARFAPDLARGLSYYTGPIFEVVAGGLGSSIASGGRYDDLVGMFSNRRIPACGGSVGLERVLLLLEGVDDPGPVPDVLVTVFDREAAGDAVALAARLRKGGLSADVYTGTDRLGKQLRYADRRGIRWCVIRGEDERTAASAAVKDLRSGEQVTVDLDRLADHLRSAITAPPQ